MKIELNISSIKTKTNAILSLAILGLAIFQPLGSHLVAADATSGKTYTFIVDSSNPKKTKDAKGRSVLHAKDRRGNSVLSLDASSDNTTSAVPVGTLVFLKFTDAVNRVSVLPQDGILKTPSENYHLSGEVAGIFRVVGKGTAVISATTTSSSVSPNLNAAHSSFNWSGYRREGASGSFTKVSSEWIVPAVTCTEAGAASSTWIGIDNDPENLIQIGTKSGCDSNSTPFYKGWWEMLPDFEVITCDVAPGDHMQAEIAPTNAVTTYQMRLTNTTTNSDCSPQGLLYYDGPLSTVEWITERPTQYNLTTGQKYLLPLPNYNSVQFSNDKLNDSAATHNYSTDSVIMTTEDQAKALISRPSYPIGRGDSFNTLYCDAARGCGVAGLPEAYSTVSPLANGYEKINSIVATQTGAWATGWEKASYFLPIAYRYADGAWVRYALPSGSYAHYEPQGIVAAGNNAWIVGLSSDGSGTPLAYKWGGASWSKVGADNGPASGTGKLYSISVDSSDTPWAVGVYGSYQPLVEKWNGSKFAYQPVSLPSGYTTTSLRSLSIDNKSNVGWAVGSGYSPSIQAQRPVVYRYDGQNWNASAIPINNAGLWQVSTNSSGDAWAIGSAPLTQNSSRPLIMHYTNGTWMEDASPIAYPSSTQSWNSIRAIKAITPYDVWLAGTYYDGTVTKPFMMHYDGSTWSRVIVPSVPQAAQVVSLSESSGSIWAAGSIGINVGDYPTNPAPYILRSN